MKRASYREAVKGNLGSLRVSKREWYRRGGFRNPKCWRKQVGGAWHYYIRMD